MDIRRILTGVSGGTASNGTAELACRVAARFGAHLTALHVRHDIAGSVIAHGAEGLAAAEHMRRAAKKSDAVQATSETVKSAFAAAAARHNLPFEDAEPTTPGAPPAAPPAAGACWREETGDAPALLSRQARFFDLIVLGRSDRVIDEPHSDAIEQTLTNSGRPVLLAPAEPPGAFGETIGIAWDGSDQAVRAMVAALPFLRVATNIVLVAIGAESKQDAGELQAYLGAHEVTANLKSLPAVEGKSSGGQLLSAARDEGADLLVLGGYGQAPWREVLFGGITSELVDRSQLPLLLSR